MLKKTFQILKQSKIDWQNHFVELIVVFIGISGAFALNNWNESKQEKGLEKKYLTSLQAEIKIDIDHLNEIITATAQDSVEISELLKLLKDEKYEIDKILPYLNTMSSVEKFAPRIVTFESIKNSGGLEIISNYELRKLIIEIYLLYDQLIIVEELTFEFLKDYWMPYSIKQIDLVKNKVTNKNFVKEVEFGNLAGGFYSAINQQLSSYREISKKCKELELSLTKELS